MNYNPNRTPAGSPDGGKFAPGDTFKDEAGQVDAFDSGVTVWSCPTQETYEVDLSDVEVTDKQVAKARALMDTMNAFYGRSEPSEAAQAVLDKMTKRRETDVRKAYNHTWATVVTRPEKLTLDGHLYEGPDGAVYSANALKAIAEGKGSSLTREHVVPAKVQLAYLESYLADGGDDDKMVAKFLRHFPWAVVTKTEETTINKKGLREKMPEGWTRVGLWARYKAAGLDHESYVRPNV